MRGVTPPRPTARIAFVVAAMLLGAFVDVSAHVPSLAASLRAAETATVLQYLILAGVSIFATQWALILAVNVVAGCAYLVATRRRATRMLETRIAFVVVFRQLGYQQALFPWVVLALAVPLPNGAPAWTLRLAAVATTFALGARVVDRVAARLRSPSASSDELSTWRRAVRRQLLFFGASLVGFFGLFAVAPTQATVLLPLLGAFAVSVPFRVIELAKRDRAVDPDAPPPVWRRSIAARRYDVAFVLLAQIAIAVTLRAKIAPAYAAEQRDAATRAMEVRTTPEGRSPARPPPSPSIRLFLVADNHFHELSGERSGVHLDLADSIVRVAVRPVELDLLSGFTLARFAIAHAMLERSLAAELPWIHLGDDGDLGCRSELDRLAPFVGVFGRPPLALVPGNHDSHFVGNFVWHPSWDAACAGSPRATNPVADTILARSSPSATIVRHAGSRTALAAVRSLGRVAQSDVVGVFVDTTDDSSIGVAGVQGEISPAQEAFLKGELAKWTAPWIVFFMHHPFDELTWGSQRCLGRLVTGAARPLAVVSAHTHLAALRSVTLAGTATPELVIGSTTDPPAETALLEIGAGERGGVAMRLRTLPAIAREGATCGTEADAVVSWKTCADVFARAKRTCADVVGHTETPVEARHPQSPAEVKAGQQVRARALLRCVHELDLVPDTFTDAPLDDPTLFPKLDAHAKALAADGSPAARARLDALTCFAWAGSALQRHKGETGWSYAHALDVAMDPATVFAAAEMTYETEGDVGTQRACVTK